MEPLVAGDPDDAHAVAADLAGGAGSGRRGRPPAPATKVVRPLAVAAAVPGLGGEGRDDRRRRRRGTGRDTRRGRAARPASRRHSTSISSSLRSRSDRTGPSSPSRYASIGGAAPRPEVVFEAVAGPVDLLGLGRGQRDGLGRVVAVHPGPSCSHRLRITPSFRSTVFSDRPSRSRDLVVEVALHLHPGDPPERVVGEEAEEPVHLLDDHRGVARGRRGAGDLIERANDRRRRSRPAHPRRRSARRRASAGTRRGGGSTPSAR